MITLAHLSDVHLAPLPSVRPTELLNKRITGYLNWRYKRQIALNGAGLVALVTHLRDQAPDVTAVTGDLVNLALNAEITRALGFLKSLGPEEKVCVSPGNHDAYVPGAVERALKVWGGYMSGQTIGESSFPYVRTSGELAVIACSSAVPTWPFFAAGRFEKAQADRLARMLHAMGEAGMFRVVLIHHPPNAESQHYRYGLWGNQLFRAVIAQAGAELVLHGHTHRSSMHAIHGPDSEVPVIGVASASADPAGTTEDPARYNLFRIEKAGEGWSCTMREFGYQRLGTEIVMRLQTRIY